MLNPQNWSRRSFLDLVPFGACYGIKDLGMAPRCFVFPNSCHVSFPAFRGVHQVSKEPPRFSPGFRLRTTQGFAQVFSGFVQIPKVFLRCPPGVHEVCEESILIFRLPRVFTRFPPRPPTFSSAGSPLPELETSNAAGSSQVSPKVSPGFSQFFVFTCPVIRLNVNLLLRTNMTKSSPSMRRCRRPFRSQVFPPTDARVFWSIPVASPRCVGGVPRSKGHPPRFDGTGHTDGSSQARGHLLRHLRGCHGGHGPGGAGPSFGELRWVFSRAP